MDTVPARMTAGLTNWEINKLSDCTCADDICNQYLQQTSCNPVAARMTAEVTVQDKKEPVSFCAVDFWTGSSGHKNRQFLPARLTVGLAQWDIKTTKRLQLG